MDSSRTLDGLTTDVIVILRIVVRNISKRFAFLIGRYINWYSSFLSKLLSWYLINRSRSIFTFNVLMWIFWTLQSEAFNLRDIQLEGNLQRRTRYQWYLDACVVPLMNMFRASVRQIICPLSKSRNYASVMERFVLKINIYDIYKKIFKIKKYLTARGNERKWKKKEG